MRPSQEGGEQEECNDRAEGGQEEEAEEDAHKGKPTGEEEATNSARAKVKRTNARGRETPWEESAMTDKERGNGHPKGEIRRKKNRRKKRKPRREQEADEGKHR